MSAVSDGQRSAVMKRVALEIMDAVSRLDYLSVRSYLAVDIVMEFPYAVPGLESRFTGINNVTDAMSVMPVMFKSFTWKMTDSFASPLMNSLIVRAKSEAILSGGEPYQNSYVILFRFLGEKVVLWREYFNSLQLPQLVPKLSGEPG